MQFQFHRKTGLHPGFGPFVSRYGIGTVYGFRFGWACVTLTVLNIKEK